jgi:hypothetical protein
MSSPGKTSTDSYHILSRLETLAAIGCVLIFLYALHFWNYGDVLRILGVGILVAGAASSSGLVLGFIFGVPRVGSDNPAAKTATEPGGAQPAASAPQTNNVTSNSNLLEISDWLTKILVGVGLVELNSIPAKLGKLSYHVGLGLRPAQCGGQQSCTDLLSSGQAAGLAIILFYFALGFLWCYVWARLYFFSDLRGTIDDMREDRVKDLVFLAEAYRRLGQLNDAMDCIDQALERNPRDGAAIQTKARILSRQALDAQVPGARKAESPEAIGFLSQALQYVNQAIGLLPGKAEPMYDKACYQALLGLDKQEVLTTLRIAFGLDTALRDEAPNDPDLKSLWQDPDFIALVGTIQPQKP